MEAPSRCARRDGSNPRAPAGDSADRQLVFLLRARGFDEVGMLTRRDLEAAGARFARVELGLGSGFTEEPLGQLPRERALADPFRPDEQEGVREPSLPQ